MRSITIALGTLLGMLLPATFVASVWAQAMPPGQPGPTPVPQQPGMPSPTAPPPDMSSGEGGLVAFSLVIAVILILAIAGKLIDLKHKREEEATLLQARISDALLRDQRLSTLLVTPTASVPIWRRSPATIQVTGQVPTPELRQAVLRLVEREASGIRPDFRVDDRMAVVPSTASRAA